MEWLIIAVVYVVVGILFDIYVHLTNPIIYWDGGHVLRSHAYLILLWPLALASVLIHALRRR